ncbi:AraC family ligand binding domain-containing protein [uncultured Clostridium sp.]|uniref:AraC family transcriptional regulator n=1 Tax=uncultured Clostridium sp. TaxID=59620 RepID=UPI00272D6D59|nr:AraC family ligand binding domain-containing protein [uncultured Clostridium sp.]
MNFNFSYRNPYDNIELNLYTCGYESCKSKHFYGPAVRSGYLIHIVLSGKGIFKVNNNTYNLTARDGFLIYPNELIYYEADENNPWEYIWIGLVGTKVNDYLNKTSISKFNPTFKLNKHSKLINAINSIINSTKIDANKNLKILSTLYDFLFELLNEFPSSINNNKNTQQSYLDEALLFIHLNFQDNVSITNIANHLSIDRSYLHRIFKNNLNLSPQEYVLNLRLEKASELLLTTSLTIGDIARSVGYNDTMLFSKTFKKHKGLTPSNYKKLNKA